MASVRKLHPTDPDSPWIVEYTDAAGKRRRKTPKSGLKKDAEKLRTKIEAELDRGAHVPRSQTASVRAVCDQFMKHGEVRLKEGTLGTNRLRIMRQAIDNYMVPKFGTTPIADIKYTDVDDWYKCLVRRGLSTATVKAYFLVAKMVCDYAIQRDIAKENPFGRVIKEHRGGYRTKIETFELDQVRSLLKAAETPGYRCSRRMHKLMECHVHLAAFCGLRFGEIRGLTLQNVGMQDGVVRVRHSLTALDELKGPKTKAGIRDVPMPEHVRHLLADWIENWMVQDDRGLIFRSTQGQTLFSEGFRSAWLRLLARAGLARDKDPYHFHALRHFAASFMIEMGWPVTEVASMLGHSAFDVTLQVYAHPVVGGNRRQGMMQALASRALVIEAQPN